MEFTVLTQTQIETWHAVAPPNEAGKRMAADTASVIAAFEAVRGRARFEDEPASFETALRETKETGV